MNPIQLLLVDDEDEFIGSTTRPGRQPIPRRPPGVAHHRRQQDLPDLTPRDLHPLAWIQDVNPLQTSQRLEPDQRRPRAGQPHSDLPADAMIAGLSELPPVIDALSRQ